MQTTATTTAIAELFRKDRQTINRACRDLTPTLIKGRVKEYQIAQVVDALIASAVAGIAGVGPDDQNAKAFAKERTAKMKAQRVALERDNALQNGKFVAIEEAGLEVERLFSITRERLLNISGSEADRIASQARAAKTHEDARIIAGEIITVALHEALEELSAPNVVETAKARAQ